MSVKLFRLCALLALHACCAQAASGETPQGADDTQVVPSGGSDDLATVRPSLIQKQLGSDDTETGSRGPQGSSDDTETVSPGPQGGSDDTETVGPQGADDTKVVPSGGADDTQAVRAVSPGPQGGSDATETGGPQGADDAQVAQQPSLMTASEAQCIAEKDLDTGLTCNLKLLGCPKFHPIKPVSHGTGRCHCFCKPGYHANAAFVQKKPSFFDPGWANGCIPNGARPFCETDMDTHEWCNGNHNRCIANFTRCAKIGGTLSSLLGVDNRCVCEDGYHTDLRKEDANMKSLACVPNTIKPPERQWGNAKTISAAFTCNKNSGGSCTWEGCYGYRGPTDCSPVGPTPFARAARFRVKNAKNCTCGEGYCSIFADSDKDVGECVPEADAQPGKECPRYAWNQSQSESGYCSTWFPWLWACDWGKCENSYCRCPTDMCADNANGICVQRASSDKKVYAAAAHKSRFERASLVIGGAFAVAVAMATLIVMVAFKARRGLADSAEQILTKAMVAFNSLRGDAASGDKQEPLMQQA